MQKSEKRHVRADNFSKSLFLKSSGRKTFKSVKNSKSKIGEHKNFPIFDLSPFEDRLNSQNITF